MRFVENTKTGLSVFTGIFFRYIENGIGQIPLQPTLFITFVILSVSSLGQGITRIIESADCGNFHHLVIFIFNLHVHAPDLTLDSVVVGCFAIPVSSLNCDNKSRFIKCKLV